MKLEVTSVTRMLSVLKETIRIIALVNVVFRVMDVPAQVSSVSFMPVVLG